jgi:hypothetical protein
MKVGERVLLPKLRSAPKDALLVADGFSCREQISHATRRRALHLAEVIQMAIHEGPEGPTGPYPERHYVQNGGAGASPTELLLLTGALLASGFWYLSRKRGPDQTESH